MLIDALRIIFHDTGNKKNTEKIPKIQSISVSLQYRFRRFGIGSIECRK